MSTLGELQARVTKHPMGAGVDPEALIGYVNDCIEVICRDREWTRLDLRFIIETIAPYTTGTVSIAAGATAGTGTGTAFTPGMTSRLIRVANKNAIYVFTYVSATSFTIDRAYEETTNAVGVTFTIFQSVYALPATLAEIRSLEVINPGYVLTEEDPQLLDLQDPTRNWRGLGLPRTYARMPDSSAGLPQIELYPAPDSAMGLPGRGYAKPPLFNADDPDTSLVIPDWISVAALYRGVLAALYDESGDKAGAERQEGKFRGLVAQMAQEDARKRPVGRLQIEDRYTAHRSARARRGFATWRNWNSNNGE